MSIREFLFGASDEDLARIADAIHDPDADSRAVEHFGARAMRHLRAVAVSERVRAAVEHAHPDATDGDEFLAAANFSPYFIAVNPANSIDLPGAIEAAIEWLEADRDEGELEEFFVTQADELFGVAPSKLDREAYAVPPEAQMAAEVRHQLRVARNAYRAAHDGTGDPEISQPATMWCALGALLSRVGPAFWQSNDQGLGMLAWGWSEPDPATEPLRRLMVSTDRLCERLCLPDALAAELHPRGSSYVTAGAVRSADVPSLAATIESAPLRAAADARFYDPDGWRRIVASAARWAGRRGLHLLEGGEVFSFAVRWPVLDAILDGISETR